MRFSHALRARRRALAQSRDARRRLGAAAADMIDAYQAQPLPTLVGAGVVGFVLAQLRVGHAAVRAGLRIAAGPGWRLVRQYLSI